MTIQVGGATVCVSKARLFQVAIVSTLRWFHVAFVSSCDCFTLRLFHVAIVSRLVAHTPAIVRRGEVSSDPAGIS